MPSMTLSCHICNKPMQRSKTSKPQGEAAHHACRREALDTCTECGEKAIAKRLCPTHYGQNARGVLGVTRPDCVVCGQPIARITDGPRPMHKPCKDKAPKWLKQGLPDPRPEREAKKAARLLQQSKPKLDMRSDIRAGYEDENYELFFRGIAANVVVSEGGCWEWQRVVKNNYPTMRFGKREMYVHRMVIEIREGAPLGVLAAHHTCGNSVCVSPDHLQPVTHRENVAEMLARNSLEARIQELEDALLALAPGHPVLRRVSHLRAA